MLKYDKLFVLMQNKGVKQIDLRAQGAHPRVFQKLTHGELIRSDTIDQLCRLLDCQPGDWIKYIPDEITD